jgi:hypothetical protein
METHLSFKRGKSKAFHLCFISARAVCANCSIGMSQEAVVGGLVIAGAALVVSEFPFFHIPPILPLTSPQAGNPIMRFTSPFVGIAFPTYQTCPSRNDIL